MQIGQGQNPSGFDFWGICRHTQSVVSITTFATSCGGCIVYDQQPHMAKSLKDGVAMRKTVKTGELSLQVFPYKIFKI